MSAVDIVLFWKCMRFMGAESMDNRQTTVKMDRIGCAISCTNGQIRKCWGCVDGVHSL